MKHKIILAVGTAVILVLGALSAHAYHVHRVARTSTETALRKALHDHDVQATEQINHMQNIQLKLETECQKFASVYPQLPLTVRNKTVAPDCSIPQ
jgi:hypothetical protein